MNTRSNDPLASGVMSKPIRYGPMTSNLGLPMVSHTLRFGAQVALHQSDVRAVDLTVTEDKVPRLYPILPSSRWRVIHDR